MSGLTNPENFFLHFGQPIKAEFDGEITASDHHPNFAPAHCLEEHLGERHKAGLGFDFEGDRQSVGTELLEFMDEVGDVFARTHE